MLQALSPIKPRSVVGGRHRAFHSATERLAWTLLHDASGSERLADDWYDSFAAEVVERLPATGLLTRDAIMLWLDG